MCQVSKPLGEDHDYWMWGGLGLKPLACYMTLSMSLTLDDSAQWLEYRFWSLNDQLNDLHRIPYLCASLIFLTNRATYFLGMLRLLIENTYHHACHAMSNLDCILKSRHYFANKGPSSQSYGFSSSHVWMWEVDYKESWVPTNWCFWTVVLEKTLKSPLDCKEIKPVNLKGNQSWILNGRTDAEDDAPVLWPPDVKNRLIGNNLILEKIEGRGYRDDRRWNCWMASLT